MSDVIPQSKFKYDAFISYSRIDIEFVRRLEQALTKYKPPKDLAVPQRHLRVFRDESDFQGVEYHTSLDRNLKDAANLIVVCSPDSAQSDYVDDEIRRFAKYRTKDHIIPVLIAGVPNNEAKEEGANIKAFPKELVKLLPIPLASDYRGFNLRTEKVQKGRFGQAWLKTLADLYADYGVDRSQVEQREQKRNALKRRIVFFALSAVGTALVALIVLLAMAWAGLSFEDAILKLRSTVSPIHIEPEMILVEVGDRRGRVVQIQKRFKLGQYEVTFKEYDRYALVKGRRRPNDLGWGRGHQPVVDVSWEDAATYAEWLSRETGKHYRLPTEAEWEYAAGKKETSAPHLYEYVADAVKRHRRAQPVGTKKPNDLGLYDMSGNVWEWVEDCWHENYNNAPPNGRAWMAENGGDCGKRVVRGGSWDTSSEVRLASRRNGYDALTRNSVVGFRLAEDIP